MSLLNCFTLDRVFLIKICLDLSKEELDIHFNKYDIKRLEMYSNNLVDYHLIMDLVPTLARIFFLNQMGDVQMSAVQSVSLYVCVT